ncbi:hypothetical protein [Methylotenera sp. L2L1]|uniref:hypothetical protein n=1 Tax=Methylotenera sp. L2L1 TaxID=1502770 RepID=UPI001F44A079|nr:hypothetical protein [Methylotenera sp. L2L1]
MSGSENLEIVFLYASRYTSTSDFRLLGTLITEVFSLYGLEGVLRPELGLIPPRDMITFD